jgi:hypothetical protein
MHSRDGNLSNKLFTAPESKLLARAMLASELVIYAP